MDYLTLLKADVILLVQKILLGKHKKGISDQPWKDVLGLNWFFWLDRLLSQGKVLVRGLNTWFGKWITSWRISYTRCVGRSLLLSAARTCSMVEGSGEKVQNHTMDWEKCQMETTVLYTCNYYFVFIFFFRLLLNLTTCPVRICIMWHKIYMKIQAKKIEKRNVTYRI